MHLSALNRICFTYGLIYFCTSLIHNIFLVYHVQVFIATFGLSKLSFWVAELIFLVWNSVNDPLFGWILDKSLLKQQRSSSNNDRHFLTAKNRANMISVVGPVFALIFMSTWFSCWLPHLPGCRFTIVLCLYDAAITILDLQKGALLADLSVSQFERSRLGSAASIGQIFSACGLVLVTSVMGSMKVENSLSPNFQLFTFILAAFSGFGLWFSGSWLALTSDLTPQPLLEKTMSEECGLLFLHEKLVRDREKGGKETSPGMIRFLLKLLRQPNFLTFSLMQALQVFHCHFNSNFFPIFARNLLGENQEKLFCILLGISFVLPHLNNVFLLKASETYGTYLVIRYIFCVKVALGLWLFVSGKDSLFIVSVFLASNRIFTEGICKLLSQVISDLIDEDLVLNGRTQPLSALIFGATALIGRPGQTFAPLFGFTLLSLLTGRELFNESNSFALFSNDNDGLGSDEQTSLFNNTAKLSTAHTMCLSEASFILAWLFPVIIGLLQLIIWSQYRLQGSRLQHIKAARLRLCEGEIARRDSFSKPFGNVIFA